MSGMFLINILLAGFGLTIVISVIRSIQIIPSKTVRVVERLGKYSTTMEAGLHLLIPFIDKVRYQHSLKEQALDVPSQSCFTLDNVKIQVDGVLYFQVMDPKKASYGITNYRLATIYLAQTTMRSVIGKLDLDKTFEEREQINAAILKEVDEATDPWGVKVTRYEIKDITVPPDILQAMEVQMRADRDRRAVIARSEGERDSKVNHSLGEMEENINRSEGIKEQLINEAQGRASEILAIAKASANSIRTLAKAISVEGGDDALNLQIMEGYLQSMKSLAKKDTQVVLPVDLTQIDETLEKLKKISITSGKES
ncbi:SPFH domain-containing protein [Salinispira pacifica]|uniref:Putative membrane protease subunit YbbK n=1 Tax=Salinispira pacifica TaxID=1307761 RepID=V5WME8_9SPIO|nr:stomatin-like protein [Salinispira pacifica]AHC16823.1 Putative membrane protease subunit YbbK [Salinispira pacifica]